MDGCVRGALENRSMDVRHEKSTLRIGMSGES